MSLRDLGVRERSCPKVIYYRSVLIVFHHRKVKARTGSDSPNSYNDACLQGSITSLQISTSPVNPLQSWSATQYVNVLEPCEVVGGWAIRICKNFIYQVDRVVVRNRRESPITVLNRKLSHLGSSVCDEVEVTYRVNMCCGRVLK